MKLMKLNTIGIVVAIILPSYNVAFAGETDKQALQSKLNTMQAFSATFTQAVTDEKGNLVHEATGNIAMASPNKLRWETLMPDETLLIADGSSVWHMDNFVEQVTIMEQSSVVENNPMVLLTTKDENVWSRFEITESTAGSDTFSITPASKQGQIKSLTISFSEQGLDELVMLDSQGQTSDIRFEEQNLNPTLADTTFTLEVPAGYMVDDQR